MTRMITVTLVVLALAVASASAQTPARTAPRGTASAEAPVNLNTATPAQLESLPGVGVATAQRIVEYREKNGGFKKIEDLMNVRGVGEKSFLTLKPLVTVTPPRTDRASVAQ